jgi:hypothetical protein
MAIIAGDEGKRRKYNELVQQHERTWNAMRKEAEQLGRTPSTARVVTIPYRDCNETKEQAIRQFIEAHKDERALYVGVDVSGSAPGSIHHREPHIHFGTFLPPNRIREIEATAAIRDEITGVPGSCEIVRPKEAKGGFDGWRRYCSGPHNLRHQNSEIFADKYTSKRAALWLTGTERKKPGRKPASAPSTAQPSRARTLRRYPTPCNPAHEPEAAIAMVVPEAPQGRSGTTTPEAQPSEETTRHRHVDGRDATPPGDPDTTDAVVVTRDLFGPVMLPREPLENYASGIVPEQLREAVHRKRRGLGWREEDLAAFIGVSRPQMVNALEGRFGLSKRPTARLVEWMQDDCPTRPKPHQRPQETRHRHRNDNTPDPNQFDLEERLNQMAA